MTKTTVFFLSFLSIFAFYSCNDKPEKYESAEKFIVDSFTITGVSSSADLYYIGFKNDTVIYSYDRVSNTAYLFKKSSAHNYNKTFSKSLNDYSHTGVASFQYNPVNNTFLYVDGIAKIFELLDTGFNTISKSHFNIDLPALKDQFMFNSANFNPIIFTEGNNMFISKANKRSKEFSAYIRDGHPLSKVVLSQDSVAYQGEAFTFPTLLSRYLDSYVYYCRNKDSIVLIYPCLDSIYTFDINTGKESKTSVGNKDFKPLDSFNRNEIMNPKYNNEYHIYNFLYEGFVFNPRSNHYLLFYKKAEEHKANSETLPTLEDDPMYVLVLDQYFKTLKYLTFSRDYFSCGFLVVPGKGIAIPRFNEKTLEDDKKIVFDIFNL